MDVILGSFRDCRLQAASWTLETGVPRIQRVRGRLWPDRPPQSTLTGLTVLARDLLLLAISCCFLLQSEVWDECGVSSKVQDPQRAFPTPWSWFIGDF
jgi:hypothetical protein